MPGRLRAWAAAWAVAGVVAPAFAQSAPEPPAPLAPPPPAETARPRVSILGDPVAVQGLPVRPEDRVGGDLPPRATPSPAVTPVVHTEPPPDPRPARAAVLGRPTNAAPVPAGLVERAGDPRPAAAGDPVGDLLKDRSSYRSGTDHADGDKDKPRGSWKFGEKMRDTWDNVMGGGRDGWFRSDHAFDGFISPVSNPFLFEDPRSLTEVRPIFIYQKVPSGQFDFRGGNISWFGAQARVAFTERWSLVFNKIGGLSVNPSGNSVFEGNTGFSELWLGPKYTFVRNDTTCTLLAGGVTFQVPVGSADVYQDTGTLTLDPYLSYGQNFFSTRFGSFNVLANTGYAFSVNNRRSDYWHVSGHLDFDVGNSHRFYPLAELNYLLYTTNGSTRPLIGAEGRDLINFGAAAQGKGLLTGAVGARYKFTESAQMGGAFEFPLAGPRDFFQYRFTVDFIWRF